jgi:uncharacterized membrane protein
MRVLALAFVIGVLNGLRSFTPPAAAAWAAHLRWIKLQGALALIGSVPVVAIFTLLAAFELVADKMPWIPDRITTMSLVARGVMGALTGACVAAAGGQWAGIGAACGVGGSMAGAFAGYHARMRSAKALGVPDIYVALVEDLICVAGALWVVTRFQ